MMERSSQILRKGCGKQVQQGPRQEQHPNQSPSGGDVTGAGVSTPPPPAADHFS